MNSQRVEDSYTEDEFGDLLALAEGNAKTGWEMELTSEMRIRFGMYKEKMFISDGQISKLEKLAHSEWEKGYSPTTHVLGSHRSNTGSVSDPGAGDGWTVNSN